MGRTSLALFTSTNPSVKLFTNLKPIPGMGIVQAWDSRQAGRQAGWGWGGGYHLTASFPTHGLSREQGKEETAMPLARKPYHACDSFPRGSWLCHGLSLLV